METLILGMIAGVAATGAMTLSEIPSWKRWGLPGVFEWHENQAITAYLVRTTKTSFAGIFLFHFLNGTLAGIAFPFLASFLLPYAPLIILSTFYGIMLWVLTLAPIHKRSPAFILGTTRSVGFPQFQASADMLCTE
jgi:hypothetical protein